MTPRIVHVASGREWRGGQRQVWLLGRELEARGINQVVVTARGSELARRLRSSGTRVHEAAWTIGLDPRVLGPILNELRRPALLHAHDAHALTLAGVASMLTGAPLIVTRRVTFPLRRRFFWHRARRIIAISRAVYERLVQDGVDPARVVVIPSAVDAPATAADSVDMRTRLGLPRTGQLAVMLGALTPEKDHLTAIRAAARLVRDLPELHWVLIGEGPERPRLQREIVQLRVSERVHLMGELDDPHRALAGADVFVLSSTHEALGTSALAAMAQGVPVVATNVGGVPEVLGSGCGVLVESQNPEALANMVQRVLRDPGPRRQLTVAAKQELGRYSASGMAEQVLSVYRSCAHSLDRS
ncbi:MAG TPA: glycosyltransferase [Gemmatimonadales bacterium]|nr:glycosyltransferase [Gemmatimonadales bacterium]